MNMVSNFGAAAASFIFRKGFGVPDREADNIGTSNTHHMTAASVNTDEYFANTTAASQDIANEFTISMWCRTDTVSGTDNLLNISPASPTTTNRIVVQRVSANLSIFLYNSSGTLFKNYVYNSRFSANRWTNITFSWDGTNLLAWVQGEQVTADTTPTDNAGTMTDTNRGVWFGARNTGADPWSGDLHSMAIWSVELTDNQVKDVFGRGAFGFIDLSGPVGANYTTTEATALQHWWRLGYTMSDVGKDYGNGTAMDIDTNAANIGTADFVPVVTAGAVLNFSGNTPGSAPVEYLLDDTGRTMGAGASYTFACWAYPLNDGSANNQVIFDVQDQTTANYNRMLLYSKSGASVTGALTALVSDGSANTAFAEAPFAMQSREWYHIVAVKNGTTSLKLYINGEEVAEDTTSIPTTTDASGRSMAWAANAQDPTATQAFDGRIAESAVWSTALSAAEVRSLYNGGCASVLDLTQNFRDYASAGTLIEYHIACDPARSGETGSDYIRTVRGSMDLSANASGVTYSADLTTRGPGTTHIHFDGSADRLEERTDAAVGIADNWTICFWAAQDSAPTAFETVFDARPDASSVNAIQIGFDGARASDPLGVAIVDNAGTTIYNYRYDALLPTTDAWAFWTVTWNGTTLRGYKDAIEDAAPASLGGSGGTQADGNRIITLANSELATTPYDGRIALVAVWDEVISDAELLQLFNMGMNISYTSDYNDYVSSANLIHQWRPGWHNESAQWGEDLSDDVDARDLDATSLTSTEREGSGFVWADAEDA
jgi:hypothetical protein